ncbi:2-dehydro-3-deoxy-phosphogluconate aldolase [Mesorhizobium sp. M2D.F.Ca.ET.185.01.1.1]|uniref:2-dehydro-3-deoxy-phosphogluconate aldolase n=1 Tax=unclassified Mesorhizobium TaxID=325217 RepID=UPI000FCB23B0|nr:MULTISPECIES: 2-dehydro-3-deoxy-phosphogluconate aldolase [unclassified Mesorhizobium]TGP55507.1 2-dehydro-3-deoxy-phosphogluconate aldolase [bacterium M00.F.Ca.ET.230.01.1.1]TGP82652.1 2-dehydro-3-deoxy-phosphogluconate aldolase [bacterium M00.F.Ca.ET.227.01.1.1]TGP94406.1 2-dehydro-3-deoxy-phosphogluconate aldolase [bacterium M00.F.Ca.ET.221.01.1.1]TGP97860.1 2-dehydro-3-deoxy-phosphogluconate aldolase [bacterium M00.F.Ca.ET.222.01.1.1]TGT75041.1 2-dehydro-3-deoxy-phosphogluconate aldolas
MTSKTEKLLSLLNGQPVIPVLKIANVADAVPLARALSGGGLRAIEITLRTADALEAIRRVAAEVEEAIVGAGTILDARQFDEAASAGAKFIVSPGITSQLLDAAKDSPVPLLPGAITPGEIMAAREAGLRFLKFFPAEQSGGIASLKAFASPLADVKFCPTGGITAKNAADYLSLPNVICVGGSWVAPDDLIKAGNWNEIEALAREASQLKK